MKASMNCSKKGSANHNERRFNLEKADHINVEKTKLNEYYFYGGLDKEQPKFIYKEDGFRKKELEYYEKTFGDTLTRKNEYYKKKGQLHKIKTMEDIYTGEKTKPEELILQFGDINDHPDPETFKKAFKKYMEDFFKWNHEHGDHIKILDAALHMDEASPHAHIRRTYVFIDKYGNKDICQKYALQQAGVKLPDPNKKEDRYNFHKKKFDEMMRDAWIKTGRDFGLVIDDAPKIGKKGELSIQKFKQEKIKEDIEEKEFYKKNLNKEVDDLEEYKDQLNNVIDEIEAGGLNIAYDLIDQLTKEREKER